MRTGTRVFEDDPYQSNNGLTARQLPFKSYRSVAGLKTNPSSTTLNTQEGWMTQQILGNANSSRERTRNAFQHSQKRNEIRRKVHGVGYLTEYWNHCETDREDTHLSEADTQKSIKMSAMYKKSVNKNSLKWKENSREQKLRDTELKTILTKRSRATKEMTRAFSHRELASQILNSTFSLEIPDPVGGYHLSNLNETMARAGAKIILEKPPVDQVEDKSMQLASLISSTMREQQNHYRPAGLMKVNKDSQHRSMSTLKGENNSNYREFLKKEATIIKTTDTRIKVLVENMNQVVSESSSEKESTV